MKVTIEQGGNEITTTFPDGATVQAVYDKGLLRGAQEVGTANTLVNGKPAKPGTQLNDGDTVTKTPTSGRQG